MPQWGSWVLETFVSEDEARRITTALRLGILAGRQPAIVRLKKQGRTYDVGFVESQFQNAWKGSPLSLKDLV